MPWAAAAAAVAGAGTTYALNKMDGGSSGTQTQTSSNAPWEPQQPYLTYGFEQAKDLYGKAAQNPVYQGPRVAGLTDWQQGTLGNAINFTNNSGGYSSPAFGTGFGLMNTGSGFGNNAQGLFNQYSGGDPTQTILNNASQYANSPYAQGMIDAAGRDVTRQLYEQQLPTLNKAATGSGNLNSTRTGVESAIATRGAADRLADISSGIRGQLFDKGLTQSQSQYNQNLQNSLAANSQLYNAYLAGNNGMTNAQQIGANNYDLGMAAGDKVQNQSQAQINADMQKFAEERGIPMDLLAKYMGIIQGNYGGSSTSNTSGTPATASTGNTLLGGAALGYGLYNKLGGFTQSNPSNTGSTWGTSGRTGPVDAYSDSGMSSFFG